MKFKQFKIRCSAIGKIMAGSMGLSDAQESERFSLLLRQKDCHNNVPNIKPLTETMKKKLRNLQEIRDNPELPQGAKTYCDLWIKEQLYNRRKEFTSKYTDKGNIVEYNSLDFISEQEDLGLLIKNEEFFFDDFMTGTPDTILEDLVIDVKNPWSPFTFPILETEIPEKDYFYQAQGYMSLTGKRAYKLIYVLSDTPDHLIKKEAFYYCKDNGYEGLDEDILEDFRRRMTYDDIEDKYKIKFFDIEYDQAVVDKIHARVEACRKYIKERTKGL